MPLRKKSNLNVQAPGQPLGKSMSSPDVSDEVERSKRDSSYSDIRMSGDVNVKRKKSWFRRIFSTFRIRKKRTLTEPSEEQSSCCRVQKSTSSTFYSSTPHGLLMEATRTNDDEKSTDMNDSEPSDDTDSIVTPKNAMGSPIQARLLDELKIHLEDPKRSKTKSELPVYGNEADLRNIPSSTRRKQRPRSADSNALNKRFSDFEDIYERTWEMDVGLPEQKKKELTHDQIQPSQLIEPEIADSVDAVRAPDPEPQPIEPLHKFPKPRPPVNRRPSTRRPSRCLEDDALSNPRRSQADLEEILQKLKDIPPPEENTSTQNAPVPKKRTKLPNSPKDEIPSVTDNEIMYLVDTSMEINEVGLSKLHSNEATSEFKALESTSVNSGEVVLKSDYKPPLPPKPSKPISRSNTLQVTSINKFDSNETSEKCDDYDEIPQESMKRWKTLPTGFQWTLNPLQSDIKVENQTSNTVTTLRDNQTQTQIVGISLAADINTETTSQNSFQPSSLDPYIEEFQNAMKHYINDLETKTYKDQSTPPNTPEQLEESNESEDDLNTVVNIYQISNGESSSSITKMHDNGTKVVIPSQNSSLDKQSFTISNEIYESSDIMSSIMSKRVEKISESERIEMSSNEDVRETVLSRTSDKPVTLKRKPHITPKPLIMAKPDEFMRRGAVRQKRSTSTSDHQTPSPGVHPYRRDSSSSETEDRHPLARMNERLISKYSSPGANVQSGSSDRTKDLEKKRRSQSLI